ncbi:MAG: sensor histidine kinase [Magnetococcales bacterium]|nr:sensor histidine kinase [Magnetococcales bacterium]
MLKNFQTVKGDMEKQYSEKINRLSHNLTSLSAHLIQDLYALIPQDILTATRNFKEQREMVAKKISSNPNDAADTFLKVLKTGISVKNEFSAYRKLSDSIPNLRFTFHVLHKVILNVTNLFLSDFAEKQIHLNIGSDSCRVNIDYESMQVAFYHILDNAVKYVKDGTDVRISFRYTNDGLDVIFKMTSICISASELRKIFEDHYSGEIARQQSLAGNGLGMGIVRELLRLNRAEINVIPGEIVKPTDLYAENQFIVKFKSLHIDKQIGQSSIFAPETILKPVRR